jgi:predicted GNAT superfamily acetyltransferase
MRNVTLADGTVIRDLAGQRELAEAVRLQEETWGDDFSERVPAAILMVAQKIGGVSAGAFSPEGRLLGFVFGLTGVRDGRLVHWSDMLAVRPEARGRHLGEALKRFQRDRCAELGVEVIYWTFDPLVSRNAHLNLNRLGARVEEFVPDMYGADTHSRMHALGTDRFVVAWPVGAEPATAPAARESLAGAPVVGGAGDDAPAPGEPLPDAPVVVVRIPQDYHALIEANISQAGSWRSSARRAFLHYLSLGYCVTAFVPRPVAAYFLTRKP